MNYTITVRTYIVIRDAVTIQALVRVVRQRVQVHDKS